MDSPHPVDPPFVPTLEEYRTRLIVHRRLSFLTPDDYARIDDMCRIIDRIGATIAPDALAKPAVRRNVYAEDLDSVYSDDSCEMLCLSDEDGEAYATGLDPAPPKAKMVSLAMYGPKQGHNKVQVCEIGRSSGSSSSSSSAAASASASASVKSSLSTTPPSSESAVSTTAAAAAADKPLWGPTEEWVPKHHILTLSELVAMQNTLDHAFSDCESSLSSSPIGSPLCRVNAHVPESAPPNATAVVCTTSAGLAVQHKTLALFSRMAARCKIAKKQASDKGDEQRVQTVDKMMKGNAGRLSKMAQRLSRVF